MDTWVQVSSLLFSNCVTLTYHLTSLCLYFFICELRITKQYFVGLLRLNERKHVMCSAQCLAYSRYSRKVAVNVSSSNSHKRVTSREDVFKSPQGIQQGGKNSQQPINTRQRKASQAGYKRMVLKRKKSLPPQKSSEGLFQTTQAALTEYNPSRNVRSFQQANL